MKQQEPILKLLLQVMHNIDHMPEAKCYFQNRTLEEGGVIKTDLDLMKKYRKDEPKCSIGGRG